MDPLHGRQVPRVAMVDRVADERACARRACPRRRPRCRCRCSAGRARRAPRAGARSGSRGGVAARPSTGRRRAGPARWGSGGPPRATRARPRRGRRSRGRSRRRDRPPRRRPRSSPGHRPHWASRPRRYASASQCSMNCRSAGASARTPPSASAPRPTRTASRYSWRAVSACSRTGARRQDADALGDHDDRRLASRGDVARPPRPRLPGRATRRPWPRRVGVEPQRPRAGVHDLVGHQRTRLDERPTLRCAGDPGGIRRPVEHDRARTAVHAEGLPDRARETLDRARRG